MALKERLEEGWIHCNIIVEMLGKPKDYIEKVIGEVAIAIGKTKGIEVINSTEHEPTEAKNGLFSTFTELELAVKDIGLLMGLVFSYMPSNIEILAPQEFKMPVSSVNELVNLVTSRLHGYDSLAKRMRIESMILKKKLEELGAIPKQKQGEEELDTIKTESDEVEEKKEVKEDKKEESKEEPAQEPVQEQPKEDNKDNEDNEKKE